MNTEDKPTTRQIKSTTLIHYVTSCDTSPSVEHKDSTDNTFQTMGILSHRTSPRSIDISHSKDLSLSLPAVVIVVANEKQ